MEDLLGDRLIRYKEVTEEEQSYYEDQKALALADEREMPPEPKPFEYLPLAEAIPKTTKFLGFFFSAHYSPPCKKFLQLMEEFDKEFNKENVQLAVILVGCD